MTAIRFIGHASVHAERTGAQWMIPFASFQYFSHVENRFMNEGAMLQLASQPLLFAFSNSYGFQTLGVSARYRLVGSTRRWRPFRILFAMDNAGLYLAPRNLLRKKTLGYLWSRRREVIDQLSSRLGTMFGT